MKVIHTSDGRTLYKSDDGRWLKKGEAEKLVADQNEALKQQQIAAAKKQADILNDQQKPLNTVQSIEKKPQFKFGNEKKWNDRSKQEFQKAADFMTEHFGDISDLTGPFYLMGMEGRYLRGAAGRYDRYGVEGKGRAIYLADFGFESGIAQHEMTHAITEYIADHYKELGYNNRDEVFDAILSDLPEYEYVLKNRDKRSYWTRSKEMISQDIEAMSKTNMPERNKKVLESVKKWYKKARDIDKRK